MWTEITCKGSEKCLPFEFSIFLRMLTVLFTSIESHQKYISFACFFRAALLFNKLLFVFLNLQVVTKSLANLQIPLILLLNLSYLCLFYFYLGSPSGIKSFVYSLVTNDKCGSIYSFVFQRRETHAKNCTMNFVAKT